MSDYSHRVLRAAGEVINGINNVQQAAHLWKVSVETVVNTVRELQA